MVQRITVIGSTNVDFIMKLPRLPERGETVTDADFMQTYGGKGANTAVGAARAAIEDRTRVAFVSCLGEDVFAPRILEEFLHDRIDTGRISIAAGKPTGSALVMIGPQGENYLAVAPGSNYALSAAHIDLAEDLIRDSAMIVMQMEIPVPTIQRALDVAARHGRKVLFNYAPVRARELPVSAQMSGLVVNAVEAEALCGAPVKDIAAAHRAAQKLLGRGPEFVIITLGAQGACVAAKRVREHVPAFGVKAVDSTAAGDDFCGALAVALTEQKPLLDAVRFASAAAALTVTRMGAQPSLPRRDEIDEFLENHRA